MHYPISGRATPQIRVPTLLQGAFDVIYSSKTRTKISRWNPSLTRLDRRLPTCTSNEHAAVSGGCPWDQEQTLDSLRPYLLEEAYEVLHALEHGTLDDHREELGDLLLQVIFQSEIRRESAQFNLADVAEAIYAKLVRRHPHVFGDKAADNSKEAYGSWEKIKAAERATQGETQKGTLDGVPDALPALLRAYRIGEKASSVGFDWSSEVGAMSKLREELDEFSEVLAEEDPKTSRLEEEFGDLLFAAVNIARHLKLDPEAALRKATFKFQRRFGYLEEALRREQKSVGDADLESLEELWNEAKTQEKQ